MYSEGNLAFNYSFVARVSFVLESKHACSVELVRFFVRVTVSQGESGNVVMRQRCSQSLNVREFVICNE